MDYKNKGWRSNLVTERSAVGFLNCQNEVTVGQAVAGTAVQREIDLQIQRRRNTKKVTVKHRQ